MCVESNSKLSMISDLSVPIMNEGFVAVSQLLESKSSDDDDN